MCGCFEVSFNFAETFQYSDDSTYVASKTKHDKGLEWVQLVEDEKDQDRKKVDELFHESCTNLNQRRVYRITSTPGDYFESRRSN